MLIKLNDEEINIEIPSICTLKDLIDKVDEHKPERHLLTQIHLNGKPISHEAASNPEKTYIMDQDQLVFEYLPAYDMGRRVFTASQESLNLILENLKKAADMFRMEDEKEANKFFHQSIENLQEYIRVVQESLVLMGMDFSQVTVEEKDISSYLEEFSNKLSEIIEIQENQDWVLLADVIEYELVPFLTKMNQIYESI